MQKAGIIEKGDKGNYYDVFAYRLMFPIFNIYNECIGFSGRILTKFFKKEANPKQRLKQ